MTDETNADLPAISLMSSAERAEHRHVRLILRRLCRASWRKIGTYQTTVGAIAAATKLPPERVAAHMRRGWLIIMREDGPVRDWTVEEDGE
jgi:hypothetical protein